MDPIHYVTPPSPIDKLLKRTFGEKIRRKVAQVQKDADELNAADRDAKEALDSFENTICGD